MTKEESKAKAEEIRDRFESSGRSVDSLERTKNDVGWVVRCKGGVVNVFDSGTIQFQGADKAALEGIAKGTDPGSPTPQTGASRKVFVVYGHDNHARTQMEAMLLRWQLTPLILEQLPSEGQTIIEKLEKYADADICFAVVLATPDDEGFPVGKADEKQLRARQNVVLELGLLLSKLGRSRVAIFIKDQKKMERPSDISGLIYIPFIDNVEEGKVLLMKEMNAHGIRIDPAKL